MAIKDALLPEFDHEMASTRKTLERFPENKSSWKPHEKSMTMGRLAGHLAELPGLVIPALTVESMDFRPPGGPPMKPTIATSTAELLALFDKNIAAARATLATATDEQMMKQWTLMAGGTTIFSLPRVAVIRSMVLNHIIHHRGQFSVYLRLNDIPVPSIYGPSADENTLAAGG
jgi:uncharacterized damage-inducible protein DinB